ncbi:MAG: hypothetical protein JOZ89_08050 [Gammaproteobacteria bacterium]|nr:hypothetical protein [Gammaproteobacteria bacterium]
MSGDPAATEDTQMLETWLVPIVAMLCAVGLPLSIPIVISVLNYRKRRRLMELYHAERMAAIERGMEIPPLPSEILGSPPRGSTLLPGLVWLFIGLALLLSTWAGGGRFFEDVGGRWVWGLVPTGVGLAYLIHYLIEGRKHREPAPAPQPAPAHHAAAADQPAPAQLPAPAPKNPA